MSPKTFWRIFLKMLGLWFILDSFGLISQILSSLVAFSMGGAEGILIWIILVALMVVLLVYIVRMFVFKSDVVISKLKLEDGFADEKIEFNANGRDVMNLAIIIIGGFIFIDTIPLLLRTLFLYYQESEGYSRFTKNPRTGWIIYYTFKGIAGYLMMIYSMYIVEFIEKRQKLNQD